MKLYYELFKLVLKKYILRKNTGTAVKDFCLNMGLVYTKFGQILATLNVGNIFTEEDRQALSSICDNINPISYEK